MDNTNVSATATVEAPTVSRRRVVQGIAWAAPAIVIATSVPAAAASDSNTCDSSNNGALSTLVATSWAVASGGPLRQSTSLSSSNRGSVQTGWTPSTEGDLNSWNLGGGIGTAGAPGFQSMSDNTLTDGSTVVTVGYTFEAVANTVYQIQFKARAQHGFHNANRSARQSVVLSAIGASGSTDLVKMSVLHGSSSLPSNNSTDAQMTSQGYTLQAASPQTTEGQASDSDFTTYTASYNAMASGTVTLRYTFTLQPVYPLNTSISGWNVSNWQRQVSDDIWVSEPTVMQSGCF